MAGVSLLVVEDDFPIRKLLRVVLERTGYRVDEAVDGVEAVLKLGVMEYDVIILDLMMPNLDGFLVIETLAENCPERLKRIIVTSAVSPALIRERIKAEPFDVLPKPFDIAELSSRVQDCLATTAAPRV